jgi:hypothetical protein
MEDIFLCCGIQRKRFFFVVGYNGRSFPPLWDTTEEVFPLWDTTEEVLQIQKHLMPCGQNSSNSILCEVKVLKNYERSINKKATQYKNYISRGTVRLRTISIYKKSAKKAFRSTAAEGKFEVKYYLRNIFLNLRLVILV